MGKAFLLDPWAGFILPVWLLTSSNNSWKSLSRRHETRSWLNFDLYCQHRQCVKSVGPKQEMNLFLFTTAGSVASGLPVIMEDAARRLPSHEPLGIARTAFWTSKDYISRSIYSNLLFRRKFMPNSIQSICVDHLTHSLIPCDTSSLRL